MFLGEKRKVTAEITTESTEPFVIHNPKYALLYAGKAEAEGDCTLTDNIVSCFIQPAKREKYILEFTVDIADEIIKKRELVDVE